MNSIAGQDDTEDQRAPPAMCLDELRRRYDALGPLTEWPGERTVISHCSTFEFRLERGRIAAFLLAREREVSGEEGAFWPHPELCRLLLEAWPPGTRRE